MEDPLAFGDFFRSLPNRGTIPCEINFLDLPLAENIRDGRNDKVDDNSAHSTFQGLFVPQKANTETALSYVDVVQKPSQTTAPEKKTEPSPFKPTGIRKVSNASTVSTKADEEWRGSPWDSDKDLEIRVSEKRIKHTSHGDFETLDPDFLHSELSHSTTKRKNRIEGRRKDGLAKKIDIGLLATVPCPREEPDRSPVLSFGANIRNVEFHSQSPRKAVQQILSLSMFVFRMSILA